MLCILIEEVPFRTDQVYVNVDYASVEIRSADVSSRQFCSFIVPSQTHAKARLNFTFYSV